MAQVPCVEAHEYAHTCGSGPGTQRSDRVGCGLDYPPVRILPTSSSRCRLRADVPYQPVGLLCHSRVRLGPAVGRFGPAPGRSGPGRSGPGCFGLAVDRFCTGRLGRAAGRR
eukprot:753360-Pyramimonas_sp.AAC.1